MRLLGSRRALPTSLGRRLYTRPSGLQAALDRGAPIDLHPEVEDALRTHSAVVALESTIITHGMPYPVNLQTARSVESIVRATGAIPATIGLVGGRVKIGLEPRELERLADVDNNKGVVKLSRRDIGPAIATGRDGGTTCSGTLIFAALAGIKVIIPPLISSRPCLTTHLWLRYSPLEGKNPPAHLHNRLLILPPTCSLGGVHRGGENCASGDPIPFSND
jgi:pseudouridine-5'-phosphate glycosidase